MISNMFQSSIIKETRTESGIKISNTFNPNSDKAPNRSEGGKMPMGGCSQDDLNIAIILFRTPGDFPSGFTRLCCLHMSPKMARMFHDRVQALTFCLVDSGWYAIVT